MKLFPQRFDISRREERVSVSGLATVAVVMSVFNHWQYTRDALLSFFSALDGRYHYVLVLIDDASSDESEENILRIMKQRSDFVYLRFKDNGGVTRSWNYGVHYSIHSLNAQYVVLANNDVLIPSGALGNLVDALSYQRGLVVAGPLTNTAGYHEKTQDIKIFLPDYTPSNDLAQIEKTSKRISVNPLLDVKEINGFFWGAHRSVFLNNVFFKWGKEVYYFNPFNRNLHNEREFQARLRQKGGKALIAANSFIFHYKDISMQRSAQKTIDPQWIFRP